MSSSALAAGIRQLRGKLAAQQSRENSDEQLLHAFLARRDEDAFAILVRRHGPMVLHVCRRVLGHEQDAEDAFQATFLVLARNAAALRKKASLASFLHGIAYRTAMKAKQSAARRRKHEGQAPTRPQADPADELSWREVRTLLDEEIARLPEIYRSVFVLSCLENASREETARRLGLKPGTVASRLAEARKRLGQRLARRGVELTAVLAATAVATGTASALPMGLMTTTIEAAMVTATGEGLAGVVSASVVELVQGAMTVSKAKIAVVVMLAASLLGGASVWITAQPQATVAPPAQPPAAKAATAPPKPKEAKSVEIQGRVFGPDGKPKVGAKLLLLSESGKIQRLGVTAADGRFTVAVPKEVKDRWLVAQTDDTGIDFYNLVPLKPEKPVELRLVKDHVIRGRIVNTEGKPVAGVRVTVQSLNLYANNSLDTFLSAWKKRHFQRGIPSGEKGFWSEAADLLPSTTDADGRFVVPGVGAERVALLHLRGTGIADTKVWVVNRAGFDPKPYNQASLDNIPKGEEHHAYRIVLHGPDVAVVAEAEKPIRGVVKDADNGKGRPGVVVHLTRRQEQRTVDVFIQATTDAEGRYELHGARKAKAYMLEVKDDPSAGYLRSCVWSDDTAGYDPIVAEMRVKKGVVLTGTLRDGSNGKPLAGFVEAAVLKDNSFAKDYPKFDTYHRPEYATEDGTFRVVAIPGPVLLMAGPDTRWGGWIETMKYKVSQGDRKYPQYFLKFSNHTEYHGYDGVNPLQGNFCKVLEIKPGAAVVKQDIVLERRSVLRVKIQDGEGRPLTGVWATGISPENYHAAHRLDSDSCSAYDVEAGKPRLLIFYEPNKKLAGSLTLKGDEKAPVAVKLGSMGSIEGRLLDADGKPLAGVTVEVGYRDREADEIHRVIHRAKRIVTDAAGAFALDELIPGRKFYVASLHRRTPLVEEGSTRREPIVHEVKPGECRDLGAIKLKQMTEKPGE
jgi:RNA polymerase sigma factor (sigma-70 family)